MDRAITLTREEAVIVESVLEERVASLQREVNRYTLATNVGMTVSNDLRVAQSALEKVRSA